MKKIVVGFDGSPASLRALEQAFLLAKGLGAGLETVSVEELPHFAETMDEIQTVKSYEDSLFHKAVLQAHEHARQASVQIQCHVVVGHPVKSLVRFLSEHHSTLLVIGPMKHGAILGALTHSTCLGLVHDSPCPVLVVR
jgi:nucleotide-binding universal stress UspA family protein